MTRIVTDIIDEYVDSSNVTTAIKGLVDRIGKLERLTEPVLQKGYVTIDGDQTITGKKRFADIPEIATLQYDLTKVTAIPNIGVVQQIVKGSSSFLRSTMQSGEIQTLLWDNTTGPAPKFNVEPNTYFKNFVDFRYTPTCNGKYLALDDNVLKLYKSGQSVQTVETPVRFISGLDEFIDLYIKGENTFPSIHLEPDYITFGYGLNQLSEYELTHKFEYLNTLKYSMILSNESTNSSCALVFEESKSDPDAMSLYIHYLKKDENGNITDDIKHKLDSFRNESDFVYSSLNNTINGQLSFAQRPKVKITTATGETWTDLLDESTGLTKSNNQVITGLFKFETHPYSHQITDPTDNNYYRLATEKDLSIMSESLSKGANVADILKAIGLYVATPLAGIYTTYKIGEQILYWICRQREGVEVNPSHVFAAVKYYDKGDGPTASQLVGVLIHEPLKGDHTDEKGSQGTVPTYQYLVEYCYPNQPDRSLFDTNYTGFFSKIISRSSDGRILLGETTVGDLQERSLMGASTADLKVPRVRGLETSVNRSTGHVQTTCARWRRPPQELPQFADGHNEQTEQLYVLVPTQKRENEDWPHYMDRAKVNGFTLLGWLGITTSAGAIAAGPGGALVGLAAGLYSKYKLEQNHILDLVLQQASNYSLEFRTLVHKSYGDWYVWRPVLRTAYINALKVHDGVDTCAFAWVGEMDPFADKPIKQPHFGLEVGLHRFQLWEDKALINRLGLKLANILSYARPSSFTDAVDIYPYIVRPDRMANPELPRNEKVIIKSQCYELSAISELFGGQIYRQPPDENQITLTNEGGGISWDVTYGVYRGVMRGLYIRTKGNTRGAYLDNDDRFLLHKLFYNKHHSLPTISLGDTFFDWIDEYNNITKYPWSSALFSSMNYIENHSFGLQGAYRRLSFISPMYMTPEGFRQQLVYSGNEMAMYNVLGTEGNLYIGHVSSDNQTNLDVCMGVVCINSPVKSAIVSDKIEVENAKLDNVKDAYGITRLYIPSERINDIQSRGPHAGGWSFIKALVVRKSDEQLRYAAPDLEIRRRGRRRVHMGEEDNGDDEPELKSIYTDYIPVKQGCSVSVSMINTDNTDEGYEYYPFTSIQAHSFMQEGILDELGSMHYGFNLKTQEEFYRFRIMNGDEDITKPAFYVYNDDTRDPIKKKCGAEFHVPVLMTRPLTVDTINVKDIYGIKGVTATHPVVLDYNDDLFARNDKHAAQKKYVDNAIKELDTKVNQRMEDLHKNPIIMNNTTQTQTVAPVITGFNNNNNPTLGIGKPLSATPTPGTSGLELLKYGINEFIDTVSGRIKTREYTDQGHIYRDQEGNEYQTYTKEDKGYSLKNTAYNIIQNVGGAAIDYFTGNYPGLAMRAFRAVKSLLVGYTNDGEPIYILKGTMDVEEYDFEHNLNVKGTLTANTFITDSFNPERVNTSLLTVNNGSQKITILSTVEESLCGGYINFNHNTTDTALFSTYDTNEKTSNLIWKDHTGKLWWLGGNNTITETTELQLIDKPSDHGRASLSYEESENESKAILKLNPFKDDNKEFQLLIDYKQDSTGLQTDAYLGWIGSDGVLKKVIQDGALDIKYSPEFDNFNLDQKERIKSYKKIVSYGIVRYPKRSDNNIEIYDRLIAIYSDNSEIVLQETHVGDIAL